MMLTRTDECRICGAMFEQEIRSGRPRSLCQLCGGLERRRQRIVAAEARA